MNYEARIIVDVSQLNHGVNIKNLILQRIANGEQLNFSDAVIQFDVNDSMVDKVLKIHDEQNPEACYVTASFIKSA